MTKLLNALKEEMKRMQVETTSTNQRVAALEAELASLKARLEPPAPPSHFLGWRVTAITTRGRSYLGLRKRVAGKGVTLYLGKAWNEALAREKVESFRHEEKRLHVEKLSQDVESAKQALLAATRALETAMKADEEIQ